MIKISIALNVLFQLPSLGNRGGFNGPWIGVVIGITFCIMVIIPVLTWQIIKRRKKRYKIANNVHKEDQDGVTMVPIDTENNNATRMENGNVAAGQEATADPVRANQDAHPVPGW